MNKLLIVAMLFTITGCGAINRVINPSRGNKSPEPPKNEAALIRKAMADIGGLMINNDGFKIIDPRIVAATMPQGVWLVITHEDGRSVLALAKDGFVTIKGPLYAWGLALDILRCNNIYDLEGITITEED